MKKRILWSVKMFGVAVLTVCLIAVSAYILRKDEHYIKNQEFYAEKDAEYDIFIAGSSHSVMGILPMELWNDYGITSYNLSNAGQRLAVDYWMLKEALENHEPSLIVVDTYTVYSDEKYEDMLINSLHESLDAMPLSKTKIEAVRDTFPEEKRDEFLFPFAIYHNRWDSISVNSFHKPVSYQKGSYENQATGVPHLTTTVAMDVESVTITKKSPETVNKEYLRKIAELCREEGIPLLFVLTPYSDPLYLEEVLNGTYEVAEEYDVPVLNGLTEDVVDYATDLYDGGHLNSSGARKWTTYLGNYLVSNYEFTDKRDDAAYASWNDDYINYKKDCAAKIGSGGNTYATMLALQDDAYNCAMIIKEYTPIYGDEKFWSLMANAGITEEPDDMAKNYVYVIDNTARTVTSLTADASVQEMTTSFGSWQCYIDAAGRPALVNTETQENVFGLPEETAAGIQFVFWDKQTGELVGHYYY